MRYFIRMLTDEANIRFALGEHGAFDEGGG